MVLCEYNCYSVVIGKISFYVLFMPCIQQFVSISVNYMEQGQHGHTTALFLLLCQI